MVFSDHLQNGVRGLPKAHPHDIVQVSTQHLSHSCSDEARKRRHRRINIDSDVLIVRCRRLCDFFFIVDCPVTQFHREVQAIFPTFSFRRKRVKRNSHILSQVLVKDTEGTFLNVSKLAPFFSFNDIQDLGETIT